jgi:DNA-binding phage protein
MPLTRSFKEFVKSRIEQDPKFRQAMFQEAVQTLIEGDVDTAKAVLRDYIRDYINATVGFPALAEATKMPPKSLMRMFGPNGNPIAVNLFGVIVALQDKTGVHLEVRTAGDAA